MDLSFTEDELAFRDEVRAFLRSAVAADIREKLIAGRQPSKNDKLRWTKILAEKGWSVPHWPVEYGGTDWSPVKQYIFAEEIGQTPAPEPAGSGYDLGGPVIYTFGSEAQKKRFLPRIATLEDWWAQGFSEPGAGSDLAALSTRAVRDGDHYIVNGQKTWTTGAQYADWIFCLVRTDPTAKKKQQGISFMLIDLKSPGVTVRPIELIDGGYEVCEVFFQDVRVPAENLVGEENRGWDYAKFLLGNERYNITYVGISKLRMGRIKELAARTRVGGERLIDQADFRKRVASIEVQLKALEMTQLRVVSNRSKRQKGTADPAGSILKIKGSEIQQAIAELLLDVVGPYALPYQSDEEIERKEPPIGPDWAAPIAPAYFNVRKVPIYGGSDEIQKNIIAKVILGL
ncbi:acyl-CoA dehydrogenase family protein [Bradyrhizobium diazoefficiens]|uniref:acyl-CoA dehydrogenase family protein n=1 Tax=Bradyrhizobium diazoefficiens TaxID=1355477 RepID=UPI00190C9858|nr:acyl-CoA dehydrogenase family protein [Bradyrhizobium diazoefficiens]QQO35570.1 acyl-CoA dehydrogenase family protein [Bradyrhizobium diazoefficiens]